MTDIPTPPPSDERAITLREELRKLSSDLGCCLNDDVALQTIAAALHKARAEALEEAAKQRGACDMTYNGGYTQENMEKECKAFHHGMNTVFNILDDLVCRAQVERVRKGEG